MDALQEFANSCRLAADVYAAHVATALAREAAPPGKTPETLDEALDRLNVGSCLLGPSYQFGGFERTDAGVNYALGEMPVLAEIVGIQQPLHDHPLLAIIITNYGRIVYGAFWDPTGGKQKKIWPIPRNSFLKRVQHEFASDSGLSRDPVGPVRLLSADLHGVLSACIYVLFQFDQPAPHPPSAQCPPPTKGQELVGNFAGPQRWEEMRAAKKYWREEALLGIIAAITSPLAADQLSAIIATHQTAIDKSLTAAIENRESMARAERAASEHAASTEILRLKIADHEAATQALLVKQDKAAEDELYRLECTRQREADYAARLDRLRQREEGLNIRETIAVARARCKDLALKLLSISDLIDFDPLLAKEQANELLALA